MGYMHLGLVRALLEAKCLPTVMGGASAGSLISAFVCVRTDEVTQQQQRAASPIDLSSLAFLRIGVRLCPCVQELKGLITPDVYQLFQPADEPVLVRAKRLFTKV